MKTTLYLTALTLIFGLTGCGKNDQATASARASMPKVVTKWKHQPKSAVGIPKGIVIETQGGEVTGATLCDLKDGSGFVVDRTLGKGRHFAEKGVIVFPIDGGIGLISAETWTDLSGPRIEVVFRPDTTNLTANYKMEGLNLPPDVFLPFTE